jgi:1,4-alpha-glucan branching enzyme
LRWTSTPSEPESEVYVAGTFNDWDPKATPLHRHNGTHRGSLRLPPGRHEYKFVINGVWCADPECPGWVPNEYGSLNSVIEVN